MPFQRSVASQLSLVSIAVALTTGCGGGLVQVKARMDATPTIAVQYKRGFVRYTHFDEHGEIDLLASENGIAHSDLAPVAESVAGVIKTDWPNDQVTVGESADLIVVAEGTGLAETYTKSGEMKLYAKISLQVLDGKTKTSLGGSTMVGEARLEKKDQTGKGLAKFYTLVPPAELLADLQKAVAAGTKKWIAQVKQAK